MLYAGASAGLDVLSGVFGYFASEEAARTAESRGRMIRMEAEADATRYAEQARQFGATQSLAYLKSGVTLEGSPLEVLAETVRVSNENISAIRARGAAGQLDAEGQASQARLSGRAGLIKGITSGAGKLAWASYADSKNKKTATTIRNDLPYTSARRTVVE